MDMVSPTTRQKVSTNVTRASRWTWTGLQYGGRAAFVVATAVLFYGIPYALSVVEESNIIEMEKEQKAREQGQEVREVPPFAGLDFSCFEAVC